MKYLKQIAILTLVVLSFTACSNEKSLQKYMVEKQDNDKFLKVDIATSLIDNKSNNLTQEAKDILKTIKKINVVAYPIKNDDSLSYEVEKEEVIKILNNENYKTLIRFGSPSRGATVKYVGEDDAIDEFIVFASDEEKGFTVFRLLGDNMKPDQMLKLMNSVEKGDLDISQLNGIGELFKM